MIDTWFKKDVEKIFNTHQIVVFYWRVQNNRLFCQKSPRFDGALPHRTQHRNDRRNQKF